jgi:hypothetical protein
MERLSETTNYNINGKLTIMNRPQHSAFSAEIAVACVKTGQD